MFGYFGAVLLASMSRCTAGLTRPSRHGPLDMLLSSSCDGVGLLNAIRRPRPSHLNRFLATTPRLGDANPTLDGGR